MASYNVHEAKTKLSQLLKQVAQGEEVIIMRDGEPAAKLVRCGRQKPKRRELGFATEYVRETPGWDKAMSKEEADRFLGIE